MTEHHSKYSPSQLPRIVRCPGSWRDTNDLENTSSSYAEEGTMLHAVTEECLKANELTVPETIKKKYKIHTPDKADLVEAVQEVLDWVAALHFKHADDPNAFELVETKVTLAGYAKDYKCKELIEVYGTLDYVFVSPQDNIIYVEDWKYGKGIEVFPDTEQLLAYAAGALAIPVVASMYNEDTQLILGIGQPRLYAGEWFKSYETTPRTIVDWVSNNLSHALLNAQSKHPKYEASEKACMWCKVKATCKHRKNMAMQAAADVFKIHAKLPDKTDEEEVADFLYKLPDLKKYIADIELYAMNILKAGRTLPGWKIVHGRSIRQWKNITQAQTHYFERDDLEFEDLTITKFKSPTQVEKLIGKKNMTEEDKDLVIKPEGKPTLVKETDKRDAIEYQNAEEKFSQFAQ